MKKTVLLFFCLAFLCACSSVFDESKIKVNKVCILYLDGYNDLPYDLETNLKTVEKNMLPTRNNNEVLLALIHKTASYQDYVTPTSPVLLRLYSDISGAAVCDTLKTYPEGSILSSGDFLRSFLLEVKEMFPSPSYGLLFSSHGTGWLPEMYYSSPKSIGCSAYEEDGSVKDHEIELPDLEKAIPYHLDYFIMDACLMGCVEVAYQLRNTCDEIMFSQTEVLRSGFNYAKLAERLLRTYPSDVCGFADEYIKQYVSRGSSACISVVDCKEMDELASVCKDLFEKYRTEIATVDEAKIQRYFRYDYHWFYDLRDIIEKAGADEEDLKKLDDVLSDCIEYSNHTEKFKEIELSSICGFSMFLPSQGSTWLNGYYTGLEWNKATNLVN